MKLAENSGLCRDDFGSNFKAAKPTEASKPITAVYSSVLSSCFHQHACKVRKNQQTNITTLMAMNRLLHRLRNSNLTSLTRRQDIWTRSPPYAFVQRKYLFADRFFVVCSSDNCKLFLYLLQNVYLVSYQPWIASCNSWSWSSVVEQTVYGRDLRTNH
jgi:hypothetical protein